MNKKTTLLDLTGLSSDQLAEVLAGNPRAYMAVKGAVAEKHLELYLNGLRDQGKLDSFRHGQGDFEKDFYVKITKTSKPIMSADTIASYLGFLKKTGRSSQVKAVPGKMTRKELVEIYNALPIELRESGVARYEFSAATLSKGIKLEASASKYLSQFNEAPVSIDFQRTRNSRDGKDGSNQKSQRFYPVKEVDIVAACLFSRTLKWEFVFAASSDLDRHPSFRSRLHNNMVLKPEAWHHEFLAAAKRSRC